MASSDVQWRAHFRFSPGISFFVKSKDQAEVDLYSVMFKMKKIVVADLDRAATA